MTLHPDILNDLVSLYHAGEASAASRALLEEEASRNPTLAAALAATAPPATPLPVNLGPAERKMFRRVRVRYLTISFVIVCASILLLAILALRYFASSASAVAIAVNTLPFLFLLLLFAGGLGALYLLVRAIG